MSATQPTNQLLSTLEQYVAPNEMQELFLPVLNAIAPDEEIAPQMCKLYQEVFLNEFESLIQQKKPNVSTYSKLNILLQNKELTLNQISQISKWPFLQNLSAKSLLSGAKTANQEHDDAVFRFLQATAGKINSSISLNTALGILDDLGPKIRNQRGLSKTKIAVVGNCTLKPFADALRINMLSYNIDAEVWETPFDQWANQMLAPDSELHAFHPSFTILYLCNLGLTNSATKTPFDVIEILSQGLHSLKKHIQTRVILILPEPLEEEYDTASSLISQRRQLIQEMTSRFAADNTLIDPSLIISNLGTKNWYASRYWYHAKLPCHPNALILLSHRIALTVAHSVSLPIKVVACDLDNTLWGGVVGEDGWQNLRLDAHEAGAPYIRFQRFLKALKEKGILLVAVSKNNAEDIAEVFNKRTEMLIKWDDFTVVVANWMPKSENIEHIADQLNIGLKQFCFLDDSEFEREEVKNALPDVTVIDLPANPEDYVPMLIESGIFHVPVLTEEDKTRTDLYRSELARKKIKSKSNTLDAYLTSLEIEIHPLKIDEDQIDRVVQLHNKTNQFNLTTRRHDYEKVGGFAKDSRVFSYCYRVIDRLGDSGISGVLIALPTKTLDTYYIDSWLLSCRVMGRTVEYAIFEHLLSWSKSQGIKNIKGEFIPTSRNKPVENLYPELGFKQQSNHDGRFLYEFDVSIPYKKNKFIELVMPS